VSNRSKLRLFDHLVGAGEERRRHFQAKRLRHDQVNDEVELGWLLNPNVGGFCARKSCRPSRRRAGSAKSMKPTVPTGVENSYFS